MIGCRHTLLVMFMFLIVGTIGAQTTFQPKPVEYNLKGIVYDLEAIIEGRVQAQGFAIAYKKGKLKSYYKTTYQNFEFGYIKDKREQRTNRNIVAESEGISNSYVYGKAHEFYQLRYSYGVKNYLSEKTRRKGLAVGWIYEGGVSLGLMKPYHLKVIRRDDADPTVSMIEELSYDDEFVDDYLDEQNIFGGTNLLTGWGGVRPAIGAHGKIAMHWALGAFDKRVKAFETGLMVDIYPRTIPILVERDEIKNDFLFIKLYASFQFGSRKRIGEE